MSQSVDRALQLLGRLAEGPVGLDELSGELAVHKTTVMRLLRTLEARRFVTRDGAHRYRLGSAFFAFSAAALEQRDVRTVAHPHLAALNARIGHTVRLAAMEGTDVVYIDKFDARTPVRMYSRIGLIAPPHSAAVSKVLLADLPPVRQEQIAAAIALHKPADNRCSPHPGGSASSAACRPPVTSTDELLAELAAVRRQGWAMDDVENEQLIRCIAAPIRDGSDAVVAAASVSAPTMILHRDQLMELLPALQTTTAAISDDLGWTRSERIPDEREERRPDRRGARPGAHLQSGHQEGRAVPGLRPGVHGSGDARVHRHR
jgi:DNA-binding IclR family transcriptional regulator